MDAQITLTGNVGNDVEFIEGETWAFARFRLACTPRLLKQGEWCDGDTTWITVRCTHRMAHHVKQSVRKGDPLVVTGKLRTHSWVNQEGQRFERLVVEATALGHDLARGVSQFTRPQRPQHPTSELSPVDPAELMDAERREVPDCETNGDEIDAD